MVERKVQRPEQCQILVEGSACRTQDNVIRAAQRTALSDILNQQRESKLEQHNLSPPNDSWCHSENKDLTIFVCTLESCFVYSGDENTSWTKGPTKPPYREYQGSA